MSGQDRRSSYIVETDPQAYHEAYGPEPEPKQLDPNPNLFPIPGPGPSFVESMPHQGRERADKDWMTMLPASVDWPKEYDPESATYWIEVDELERMQTEGPTFPENRRRTNLPDVPGGARWYQGPRQSRPPTQEEINDQILRINEAEERMIQLKAARMKQPTEVERPRHDRYRNRPATKEGLLETKRRQEEEEERRRKKEAYNRGLEGIDLPPNSRMMNEYDIQRFMPLHGQSIEERAEQKNLQKGILPDGSIVPELFQGD